LEERIVWHPLQQFGGRQVVGLGQDDVEADRRGAVIVELAGEVGEDRSRPGPLTDFGERVLIDVNDADRQFPVVVLLCHKKSNVLNLLLFLVSSENGENQ